MANGINDILSVYRQSLASERQAKLSEMQIALQGLQFEAQQKFREEGRAREDALTALEFGRTSAIEAITNDAQMVYSRIASHPAILEADYDEDSGALKKTTKIIKRLVKDGFSSSDATQMVSIANTYGMSSKNPNLASSAQEMAVQFGTRVARDFDIWKRSGYAKSTKDNQVKSPLITAMQKSGMMYGGADTLQIDQSADVFMGVAEGSQIIENIKKERTEMGSGDYNIDSPINMGEIRAQEGGGTTDTGAIDFNDLVNQAGVSLGLSTPDADDPIRVNIQDTVKAELETGLVEGGALESLTGGSIQDTGANQGLVVNGVAIGKTDDASIMQSIDFLPDEEKDKIQLELDSLNELIANKASQVDSLYSERDNIISDYRVMEQQYDVANKRYNYLRKASGDKDAIAKAKVERDKSRARISGVAGSGSKKDINAVMEFEQSAGGKQRGSFSQAGDARHGWKDTVTNDIINLSKEIEELSKQKAQYGNF